MTLLSVGVEQCRSQALKSVIVMLPITFMLLAGLESCKESQRTWHSVAHLSGFCYDALDSRLGYEY